MSKNNYQIYFDCGFSKLRAGAFNKTNLNENFYTESKFFLDHSEMKKEIQNIIFLLEKDTEEYIKDVNLMIDSPKMLSIGISISKKIDGSHLRQEDVQFLVQEAKQQILKNYDNQNIVHIIIDNYKINDVNFDYLPTNKKCDFISLDIVFICLPKKIIENFKKLFYESDILISRIICSSYAKAINYKDIFPAYQDLSFIDIGFNKTSIITYVDNKINSFIVLPVGGNHITKDISKVLKMDIEQAENLKISFDKNVTILNDQDFSLELVQKIIFARTEEILEICVKSIGYDLIRADRYKMILTGEGSKILDNQHKDKIFFSHSIDFLEETNEDICLSGFKLGIGLNKQEVIMVPKKLIKQGFFEKLFHFFR